jgi:hypothetical protein
LLLQSLTPSETSQRNKWKKKKKENFAATATELLNRPSLSAQTICLETNAKTLREKQTKHRNNRSRRKPPKAKEKRETARVLQTLNEAPRPQGKTWNHLVR